MTLSPCGGIGELTVEFAVEFETFEIFECSGMVGGRGRVGVDLVDSMDLVAIESPGGATVVAVGEGGDEHEELSILV